MTDPNPMRSLLVGLLAREAMNHVPLLPHFSAVQLAEIAMQERGAEDSSPHLYLELCDIVVTMAHSRYGSSTRPPTVVQVNPPGDRILQEPGTDEP